MESRENINYALLAELTKPDIMHETVTLKKTDNSDQFELTNIPVSDHDTVITVTQFGVVASLNFLYPGSPVGPGFLGKRKGFYKIVDPEFHEKRMNALAVYVAKLFCAGVNILMMQEVPPVGSEYYEIFLTTLKKELEGKNVTLNWSSLEDSYKTLVRATKQTINQKKSYYDFGCALLVTKEYIVHNKIASEFNERSFVYSVEKENNVVTFCNIHGDSVHSKDLAKYITDHVNEGHIVAADTNIPLSNTEAIATISKLPGNCQFPNIHPNTKFDSISQSELTIDGLFISQKYEPVYVSPSVLAEKTSTSSSNQKMFNTPIIKTAFETSNKNNNGPSSTLK